MSLEGLPAIELPMTKREFKSLVGEGLHVGLRKGSDGPSAHELWEKINATPYDTWNDALEYMAWGFEYMEIFKFQEESE